MRNFLLKIRALFVGKNSANVVEQENKDVSCIREDDEHLRKSSFFGINSFGIYSDVKVPVVFDFVEPRYVYDTLEESTEYNKELGEVIGYRLDDDLVIHSIIPSGYEFRKEYVKECEELLGGTCLDIRKDLPILIKYWREVSLMRVKSGLQPLPKKNFWVSNGWGLDCVSYDGSIECNQNYATIIVKRNNVW